MYLGISLSIPCRFLLCFFLRVLRDPHRSKRGEPVQNMFDPGRLWLLDAPVCPLEKGEQLVAAN